MKRLNIILAFSIAIISFVVLATVNTSAVVQALIALPGSAGLVTALWEILQSNIEHQHRLEEKSAENAFILSATSHMAQKAFDKHVSFCEEYLIKVDEGLIILFQEGPTKRALGISAELYGIRKKYIVWETTDVSQLLNKFEQALRNIGADEFYLDHVPVGTERTQIVNRLYSTFKDVTTFQELPNNPTPEIAVANIIAGLRDHLGVPQLTALRKFYLSEATKRIPK